MKTYSIKESVVVASTSRITFQVETDEEAKRISDEYNKIVEKANLAHEQKNNELLNETIIEVKAFYNEHNIRPSAPETSKKNIILLEKLNEIL